MTGYSESVGGTCISCPSQADSGWYFAGIVFIITLAFYIMLRVVLASGDEAALVKQTEEIDQQRKELKDQVHCPAHITVPTVAVTNPGFGHVNIGCCFRE